jgi:putative restriction endonuclease
MKFFVAVTDNQWYHFLSYKQPDEVNFWRPGGGILSSLEIGSLFLFKLHLPFNYIVGGGFFLKSEKLPLSLAWDTFQEKNGTSSFADLLDRIRVYRNDRLLDPLIGCNILNQPFFLPRELWIPAPTSWHANIVIGKYYETTEREGFSLWSELAHRMQSLSMDHKIMDSPVTPDNSLYGKKYLVHARLGQGAFRLFVTDAYNRRCTITGEKTLPALEAAHIKPYKESGPNRVANGILMRSDFHRLYDRGFITITPDYRIEISSQIRERYENGRDYYAFKGRRLLIIPRDESEMPNKEYLTWHNENIFLS